MKLDGSQIELENTVTSLTPSIPSGRTFGKRKGSQKKPISVSDAVASHPEISHDWEGVVTLGVKS